MCLVRCGDNDGRSFGNICPRAPRVIVVVMREHKEFHRFAGILRFCRIDGPPRLPFVNGGIEHDKVVLARDDQAVVRAAGCELHVRRQFDELEPGAGRGKIHAVAIEEAAEKQSADHPLIGNRSGRRHLRLLSTLVTYREGLWRDSRIDLDFPKGDVADLDVIDPVRMGIGHFDPADLLRIAAGNLVVRSNRMVKLMSPSAKATAGSGLFSSIWSGSAVSFWGALSALRINVGEARSSSRI